MVTRARTLEVAARPSPLLIDADRTAVIVVDMQNDFCDPAIRPGALDGCGPVAENCERLAAGARRAGLPVPRAALRRRPRARAGDGRLARVAYRRRGRTLIAWVVALVAAVALLVLAPRPARAGVVAPDLLTLDDRALGGLACGAGRGGLATGDRTRRGRRARRQLR